MAYIFDPIQGTFIDDKDKTLGNKLMLADLVDDLEPGPLKDEMQEDFDPSQETYEEYLQRKRLGDRPFLMADGGRVNLQDGTNPIPKAPDLRALAGEANRTAREAAKAEYAKQVKTYIENEIKNFEKTKILPNEKYEIITKKILRDLNITETGATIDFINDIVKQIDLPYYIDKKTGPKISPASDAIDEEILKSFKKNYKTQTVSQIIEKITGLNSRNLDHKKRAARLGFKVNKLIDRNIINKEDIKQGKTKPDLKINRPISYTGFKDYERKRISLLKGLPDKEKYIAKRGKYKGKIAPHVLDVELLKFLNYDTIKGSLSPDFPSRLLPSFEHVEGVTPASIIGDSEGLRKVELNTRRYNWNRTDGMAGKSPLYRRVKNFLKTAVAELEQKNKVNAKNALNIVNKVYDKITKRFNRNRKELPSYKIKNNKVVETNLKGLVKPETLSKSYLKYFKNVAASATDNELNKIKKIQPAVHQVLINLKNAKEADAVKLIKIRLPDITSKGGSLFSFAGAVPLPEVELSPKITNAFKSLRPVLSAAGKTVAVADPIFAAMDFSKAIDTGVSGKQAASFTAKKFIQDMANLPRTIEDLAFTATEEGTFKNFGDKKEEDRLFKYEPFTFADKSLQADVDATAPEILEARKAIRDFDVQVLPGMTMVDDMEIPASKEEIDAAQDRFMDARGVDLSVLDNLEEDKTELSPIIKSLIAPDQTLNQFLANGGRVGFSNGGAAGADENFAKELEYYFLNEDAELPQAQSFKETMNPIEILNDMIDPRNLPYYADVLLRSGIRIGEFAGRILPAAGKLASDLIRKPAFKVTGDGGNYVQDYDEVPETNIKGTGIFTEFLENITPTATEKAIGLESLIQTEEQKLKDRRSTIGPKVFADTFGLGLELTAPIFPGLKLLNAYAAAKKLPKDKVTEELLNKEIDQVLAQKGMTRREFLQMSGAGATVALAKMLGIVDFFPKAGKVSRATSKMAMDTQVTGMPAWFKDAVYAIERKGVLKSRGDIKGVEPDFFEMTLNTRAGNKKVLMSKNDTTGEITIDWKTNYYDTEIPVTITYKPGESGYQNLLSDPEFPQSVERYNVEVGAPEFEYKTVDVESMGPEDTSFDSAINLDIKEEADAVVEALEELGLTLTKGQKKEAAENFRYYNEVELDDGFGPDTKNPIDENDVYTLMDSIKRNQR